MALSVNAAHASVILTPSNPSVFAVYPAPIPLTIEENQKNDGFIIILFADTNFEGEDDLLRIRGFSTTDGSGIPYLDAVFRHADGNVLYGNVPHIPSDGSILVSLVSGTNANLKAFLVGYHDEIRLEYDEVPVPFEAVPAPATLPLFATGLGLMGLLAWRKKGQTV